MMEFPENIQNSYFKRKPFNKSLFINLTYFIKEYLCMSASDGATFKKDFGGSKPSLKLTSKTKWYHSCGCCDDSPSFRQLKKHLTGKYFEKKLDFEP